MRAPSVGSRGGGYKGILSTVRPLASPWLSLLKLKGDSYSSVVLESAKTRKLSTASYQERN